MSYSTALYFLLLIGNTSYHVSAVYEDDSERYCRLCRRHTMCLFPFDDPGPNCRALEPSDLDQYEIESIVHEHNIHRSHIASGKETRGNPGPQPPARSMMELSWDEELASLARRWALQCVPLAKDECRDVERFGVWQNVHVWPMDPVELATSSHHRIPFHIQSWLDDVENFDSAEVGLVDLTNEERDGYIGLAAGMITRVGCGRALYSVDRWIEERHEQHEHSDPGNSLSFSSMVNARQLQQHFHQMEKEQKKKLSIASGRSKQHSDDTAANRLEVLVCNYGPIDRTLPGNLYEDGMPGNCPMGFHSTTKYQYLCSETEVQEEQEEEHWRALNGPSASQSVHSPSPLLFICALQITLAWILLSER